VCEQIHQREAAIVADILGGSSLAGARADHGYHRLQRKETAS